MQYIHAKDCPMVKNKDESAEIPSGATTSPKEKLRRLIEEETKMVKGRFRFHECPGAMQKIQCQKYPGVPMFSMDMVDGEIYTIPLWVARHLNGVDVSAGACSDSPNPKINSCSVPQHDYLWADGSDLPNSGLSDGMQPVRKIGVKKWDRRFSFESMEFDVAI